MKNIFLTLALALFSTAAFGHPGGHSLVCKSPMGTKSPIEFTLARSNGPGWYAPSYSITEQGKKHEFKSEDEMQTFGETFHNSPLGVITVTADNREAKDENNASFFRVVAIPATVKAYDDQGKRVKWTLEIEKNDCNDANGRATFKGILNGGYRHGEDNYSRIQGEVLDCELEYNSGMAC